MRGHGLAAQHARYAELGPAASADHGANARRTRLGRNLRDRQRGDAREIVASVNFVNFGAQAARFSSACAASAISVARMTPSTP